MTVTNITVELMGPLKYKIQFIKATLKIDTICNTINGTLYASTAFVKCEVLV